MRRTSTTGWVALAVVTLLASCDGTPPTGACSDYVCDGDQGTDCHTTCASNISASRCAEIYGDFTPGKTCEDIGLQSSCSPLAIFLPGADCI